MTQDNKDLLENRIPFGLLDPDVQERMKAWEHGWEWWSGGRAWSNRAKPAWGSESVYRAKPAPVEPERVTWWVNVYPSWVSGSSISRAYSDSAAASNRIALWRITYDKVTGLNPVIEVEQD